MQYISTSEEVEEENSTSQQQVEDLFLVLSNKTSLRIFRYVSRGGLSAKQLSQKVGISESACRDKLKRLVELSLLVRYEKNKREGDYALSPLGQIVYQTQAVRLYDIVVQNNRMQVLSKIIEKNNPPENEFDDPESEAAPSTDPRSWNTVPQPPQKTSPLSASSMICPVLPQAGHLSFL